ncbi:uncharacterized protein LOC131041790 isoform X2 [Cryptomeria japonica]|uniref:uncharacterized protein LOC131041790 isoform X2 n=1 Tax=Cryptomeria japonica TaxID=3369 RepID=UPI0027DA7896|nr:uncharacterized protein LOC131041790 isoform X2 [Cryptomeria japonica]
MFDCEVQSARKRRLWGKYYTRKCNVKRSVDGQNESLSTPKKVSLPRQGAGACENTLGGQYSTSLVESFFSHNRPDRAKGDIASNNCVYAENVSFSHEFDAFCICSSNVGERNSPVSYVLSEGESASKSEVYGVFCTENGQENELGVSIENAEYKNYRNIEFEVVTGNGVAPVDHIVVKDDTVKSKTKIQIELGGIGNVAHLDHSAIGDAFHICSSNVGERNSPVSYGLSEGESASKSEVYGVLRTENGQENELGGSIENAEYKNYCNIEFEFVKGNVVAPVDHFVVRDDTVKCKNKIQIELGSIGNVVANLDHSTIGDDTDEYKYGERTMGGSFENPCTENKGHIQLGNAMVNNVVLSHLIAVRDDKAECMLQEKTVTESNANLCSENKQQIGLEDDVGNVVAQSDRIVVQSDHIVVRHDTAQHKHGQRMLAESMTTLNAQNKTLIEFMDDKVSIIAPSDFIAVKGDASEYKPQEKIVADKCVIKDQNPRQEHAMQVEVIPSNVKPDEIQDYSTKFHATSNACGSWTESSCLVTGKCTGLLKYNKDSDDFRLQQPINCHANACQLIDHDRQIKRTGPILRSRKIYLATSVVKKHQRRIMSSMPSEGGKLRKTTFIGNRLKKNAVKGLLENYLKDWMDKNVQEGSSENEHCLPFLVNAPKRVECFQCKGLVMPGKEVMCANIKCRQVYHLVCAKQLKGSHWFKKREFRCSHHVCMVCNSRHGLWRCVRCPVAVHKDCSPWPEAMVFLRERPGPVICWRHNDDWRLEHKRQDRTNDIKEAFLRLPVPYFVEDFKIEAHFWRDVMGNENEPQPYVQIRRNDGVGCSCGKDAIVCGENCECRVQSMSCSKACRCSEVELCTNKPFRKEKRIKIIKTKSCGWGAEAAEVIKKGEFVIEYVGEVINDALCEERLWEMKHRGVHNFYMCEIGKDFIIDATFKGNQSRFLNHSCDPNCKLEKWRVDGETRVGIFAAQDIRVGESLTYDYRFIQFGPNVKCHCGAANCQGDLGEPFGTNGVKTGGSRAVISKQFRGNSGIALNTQLLQWGSKRARSS